MYRSIGLSVVRGYAKCSSRGIVARYYPLPSRLWLLFSRTTDSSDALALPAVVACVRCVVVPGPCLPYYTLIFFSQFSTEIEILIYLTIYLSRTTYLQLTISRFF